MKYNYNNEWNDINFKISDTLPVGAEVDYDGETVPSGWEEITDPEEYSTSEVKTNKKWIDGKPIYRKVIDLGVLPNNSTKEVDSGLTPHSIKITNMIGVCSTPSSGYHTIIGDYNSRMILLPNGNIEVTTNADYNPFNGTAILEYTKTTD